MSVISPLSLSVETPPHYRLFFRRVMRFAIVMMLLGLLMGIVFQESSKKAPVSDFTQHASGSHF